VNSLTHPDLPEEQEYIDGAFACLDEMREEAASLRDGAGDTKARNALFQMGEDITASLDEAEDAICAGRIDSPEDTLYIGRRALRDSDGEYVVINWRADAARPFYEATPDDPCGLDRRRRFILNGRVLEDIADELFSERFRQVAPEIVDVLLQELERKRGSEMRDIVATIQAKQFRLITQPLDGGMVVQGGPGTGKTAVLLHRAAWLLSRYRRELRRGVLVVGPNPTFMRYISRVLPGLGESEVDQASLSTLVAGVRATGRDDERVMSLKGDPRMAAVIKAAVERRIRPPTATFTLTLDGYRFSLTGAQIAKVADVTRSRGLSYMEGRNQYRNAILRALYEAYRVVVTGRQGRVRGPQDFESTFRRSGAVQRFLDRSWPSTSSRELLHELLEGPRILADAAKDALSEDEQLLLLRSPVERIEDVRWTESDIPLLDEADSLLQGTPERWGHVIVDEAQDLTPMQLRMVSRRAVNGSMTLAGDIAQATGPCVYDTWEEISQHLLGVLDPRVEELTDGYRVAGQVMAFAARLLPTIAPGAAAPVAYRPGAGEPAITQVRPDELLGRLVDTVTAVSGGDGTLGVIVPERDLRQVSAVLDGAGIEFGEAVNGLSQPIEVLTPRAAKGLEFDDVVVLEPSTIAEDGANGLRELYVALTRATQQLYVLHARELPRELTPTPARGPLGETAEPVPLTRSDDGVEAVSDVGLTDAFALGRIAARGSTRGLARRLLAAALVLQHQGPESDAAAALLLPGPLEPPPVRVDGRPGDTIARCLDVHRAGVVQNAASEEAVRVLLADAAAAARTQESFMGASVVSDDTTCRALIEVGRSMPTVAGLATELEELLSRE
jgi:DNA helicase IV